MVQSKLNDLGAVHFLYRHAANGTCRIVLKVTECQDILSIESSRRVWKRACTSRRSSKVVIDECCSHGVRRKCELGEQMTRSHILWGGMVMSRCKYAEIISCITTISLSMFAPKTDRSCFIALLGTKDQHSCSNRNQD